MEPFHLETDPDKVKELARLHEEENLRFKTLLKHRNGHKLDLQIHRLHDEVAPHIDCTACGNCCKQLSPYLTKDDLKNLCIATDLEPDNLISIYTETDAEGVTFNMLPCPFLADNKCTVYHHRPGTCASFPHLHKPDTHSRLRRMMENYEICPIIFNVVEMLKVEMQFK